MSWTEYDAHTEWDKCDKATDGQHVPDPNTVHIDYDGGELYIDLNCKLCGQSGCVGKVDLSHIDW